MVVDGFVFFGALVSQGAKNAYFGDYRIAYEERMERATDAKAVTFLTTRYDGTLEKRYQQLVHSGKAEAAAEVKAERERIRSLEKVVSAKVFRPVDSDSSTEVSAGGMAEIECFGIKQTCSRPVFLLHAGPASMLDPDDPMKGRIKFDVLRNRLLDTISGLPSGVEFNAALFWAAHTSAFAAQPLRATFDNKAAFDNWLAPVNALDSNSYYGRFPGDLQQAMGRLDWSKRLDSGGAPDQPKWFYNYTVGNRLPRGGSSHSYIHWARALCFAFEQKADAIYIITPNLIWNRNEELDDLAESLEEIMEKVYGKGSANQPSINFIMVARKGHGPRLKDSVKPAMKVFDGELQIVDDIEDWMTDREKDRYDSL